jgi:hypothetical protein
MPFAHKVHLCRYFSGKVQTSMLTVEKAYARADHIVQTQMTPDLAAEMEATAPTLSLKE